MSTYQNNITKEDINMSTKKKTNKKYRDEEFEALEQFIESYPPHCCENNITVIKVPFGNKYHRFVVGSQEFKDYLRWEFEQLTGVALKVTPISTVESYLRNEAFKRKPDELNYRIKKIDDVIYYDLCNDNCQYIVITKDSVTVQNGELNFLSYNLNQTEQVMPNFDNADINLLRRYVNIDDKDWVLFIVYLITCFIENIPHPILNINGVWGSGKSTVSKIVKSLVDPARQLLTDLPKKEDDLIVTLASSYYNCFDNISSLTQETSNFLCKCVYGGNASFRQFYCHNGIVNIPYHCLILLNGISDFIKKGDLAQRTIYMETLIIDENDRLTETEFWKSFNKDKPYILGSIFNILSKAISLYNTIEVKKLHRLGDFHKWGCAIAKAISPEMENRFVERLNQNTTNQLSNTLENNTMLTALFDYLEKYEDGFYNGSVSDLFRDLRDFIESDYRKLYNIKYFPNAANSFGKKLKGYVQLCENLGWIVDIYKDPKSGNSHVHISQKQKEQEQENEAELDEEVVIDAEKKVIERHAIFERTPIVERHAIFERKPIIFNKSERVRYYAQLYKENKFN